MTGRRGFTLLEVMVATTVMGIAVVTLMSGLSTSVRNASRLTDYDRAALLARAKMDALLVDPKLPLATVMDEPLDPSLLGGARGGWRAQVTPFETAPSPVPGAFGLDRVQLEIWWMSGDRRRSFSLEAFRRSLARTP
jgi:general secretion pathway protein I